jgi:hypothetical protein
MSSVKEAGISTDYLRAIMGTWRLVPRASRFSSKIQPQDITRKYEPSGDGYTLRFEQISSAGIPDTWEYTANYDGKDYPVKGTDDVDTIALTQVDERTTLGVFKKDGQESALYKRTIASNGDELTITTAGINSQGEAYYDVTVYERISEK